MSSNWNYEHIMISLIIGNLLQVSRLISVALGVCLYFGMNFQSKASEEGNFEGRIQSHEEISPVALE